MEVGGGAGVGVIVDSRPHGGRRKSWGQAEAVEVGTTTDQRRPAGLMDWMGARTRGVAVVDGGRRRVGVSALDLGLSGTGGRASGLARRSLSRPLGGSRPAHKGSGSRQGHRVRID